jgi:hypothetical protein
MNICDLSDEEILEIANPWWDELLKYSNNRNYLKFIRNFSYEFMKAANEVEIGKQFAKAALTKNLDRNPDFLGIIRRGEHVTVLYRQRNEKLPGEWLGRLVLGYENDEVKIFGATIF